jgi:hypothetical protein
MINLASSSVSDLFTIPAAEWTVINKRVGQVLATTNIKDYISSLLAGYPNLLSSCEQWQSSTFSGLILHSKVLSDYAAQSISNFNGLNEQVKQVIDSGSQNLPDSLKQEIIHLLQKLSADTAPIAAQSNELSTSVLNFLNFNVTVDAQMASYKGSLDTFWEPLGDNINQLETAAGHVTGTWSAITDDLNFALTQPIIVTIPFLQSLNIDGAILNWQNIQKESIGFPALTAGQQQYWTNPF